MSVDLNIDIANPISLTRLVEETKSVLLALLNTEAIPQIELSRIVNGATTPIREQVLEDDALYGISYIGLQDRVLITTVIYEKDRTATVSVGRTREPTEYILGLACALAIAIIENVEIRDEFGFWTGNKILQPSLIINSLSMKSHRTSFQGACLALVGERLK